MKFTNEEKLIVLMLAEIYDKLGIKGEIDTKLITNAIYTNNTWAIDWKMPGILGYAVDPTPTIVEETSNILDMWQFIEEAYEKFTAAEKAQVKTAYSGRDIKFTGFDGNNEAEFLNIASFLIDDMGRFSRFKGRDLNCHYRSIDRHRRMYQTFDPMRSIPDWGGLSPTQLVEILKV